MGKRDKFKIVEKKCGHGHAKVSLVKRKSDGELFIWKRPKSGRGSASLGGQIKRSKFWRKIGISKVKIKWCPDRQSLLHTFVDGHTLRHYLRNGDVSFSENNKKLRALKDFVKRLIKSKGYIHDLKGSNIVWDGDHWNVIDSGKIDKKSSSSSTKREYKKFLYIKWSNSLDSKEEKHALKEFLDSF